MNKNNKTKSTVLSFDTYLKKKSKNVASSSELKGDDNLSTKQSKGKSSKTLQLLDDLEEDEQKDLDELPF